MFQQREDGNRDPMKGEVVAFRKKGRFQEEGVQIWIAASKFSKIIGNERSKASRILKKAQYQGHPFVTRETYGNGGKRRKVLFSSLPKEVQALYFEGDRHRGRERNVEGGKRAAC